MSRSERSESEGHPFKLVCAAEQLTSSPLHAPNAFTSPTTGRPSFRHHHSQQDEALSISLRRESRASLYPGGQSLGKRLRPIAALRLFANDGGLPRGLAGLEVFGLSLGV